MGQIWVIGLRHTPVFTNNLCGDFRWHIPSQVSQLRGSFSNTDFFLHKPSSNQRKIKHTFQPPPNSFLKKVAGILLGQKMTTAYKVEDAQKQTFILSFFMARTLIPTSIDLTCKKLGELKRNYLVHAAAQQVWSTLRVISLPQPKTRTCLPGGLSEWTLHPK